MYDFHVNLIIGFHGCDESVKSKLLNHSSFIKKSENPYDWLGHGMYFWENNPDRAMQFAEEKAKRGEISKPAVVGAVLQLGYCCDFLDAKFIGLLQLHYQLMSASFEAIGRELPSNHGLRTDPNNDNVFRTLDCSAIEYMHQEIEHRYFAEVKQKQYSDVHIFDSVRGVFTEGAPAFEGAGIFEKSHIQICIRNPNCIKGFFNTREEAPLESWVKRNK